MSKSILEKNKEKGYRGIIEECSNEWLHYINFRYKDKYYQFSGWWGITGYPNKEEFEKYDGEILFEKDYDRDKQEEFLHDKLFDGKTLYEIQDEVEILDLQDDDPDRY